MENEKKPDIFDRIMSWGFLKRFEPFYKAHKEVLMYLFFGGLTTVVGVGGFKIFADLLEGKLPKAEIFGAEFQLDIVAANVIAWVIAVTFSYVTNRIWVFEDKAYGAAGVAKECAAFFAGRLFTLVLETVLLEVLIAVLLMNKMAAKIVVSIITIILNYVISKLIVFRKAEE